MVAIGTLALAIAAATATVSVVSGVLLRDIPIERPGDVFVLWKMPAATTDHLPITYAQLTAFRAVTRSFSAVAGVAFQGAVDVAMLEGDRALSIAATWVTGDFFTVLGPVPAAGRLLSPADDAPGAEPVMVISHRFWQSHFGASPSVLGRGLLWNGKRYAIVGILPRGFEYPKRVDAWMPVLSAFPATRDASEGRAEIMVFDAVGRLRAHQAAPSARKDFAHFLHADDASGPADERGMRPVVTGLTDLVVGDMSRILRAVAAAVSLLLLVACMNVATLQLVRGEARANELAIRTALGASRARLIQQLLTEAGVVALVGGAAGIAIATGSLHTLIALVPASLPQRDLVRRRNRLDTGPCGM